MHQHAREHHDHQHDEPHPRSGWPWFRVGGCLLAILAIVAAVRSIVIVDQTEAVFITEFGKPVQLLREPGLHFKRPYQSRRAFDMRLQVSNPPPREMLTKDKKNLEIAWYAGWKIADVERFLKAVRTVPDAAARLEDMAASVIAAELGGYDLGDIVKVGDGSGLEQLMGTVRRRMAAQSRDEFGIDVVDVQLSRLNYPEEVRSAVFEQIRSERKRVAAATRAEGESQARRIRSAADRERARVVAEAEAEATRTVGEGEAESTRIANQAHSADPGFYRFLKTLETYKSALDKRTTLVLSADSPFLKLLTQGVAESSANEKPAPGGVSPGVARRPSNASRSSEPETP